MKTVNVICDRCKQFINGILDDIPSPGVPEKYTGGYYDVSNGYWNQFAKNNERKICDACMHSDPKYIKIFKKSS